MSWSVTGVNPVFAGKYTDDFNFYNDDPVVNFFITIIAPASRKLQLKAFNNAPAPQEQLKGGNRVYHWDNPPIQVTGPESNTPSWYNPYPHTSITEYNSWEEVIYWAVGLFHDYRFPLPAGLQERIAGWRKTANGNKDIFADLATRFVQDEIRYLGLEMGEHTHLPHSPADVYLHRFGDCKDKALLLATILQQEHIPAFVALVNTSLRRRLEESAPSGEDFDHAIVAIERPQGYLFVDPTASLQGGNLFGRYIPAYGYALVVRAGEKNLQPISPIVAWTTDIVEKMDIRYNDSSRLDVDTRFSGGAADDIRTTVSNSSLRDLEEDNRKFYAKVYEGTQLAAPMQTTDDSTRNEYHIHEYYSIPDVWQISNKGEQTFDVFTKLVYDCCPDPATLPAGTPLAIAYPRKLSYRLELNMPEDWTLSFAEWHTKNDYYEFHYEPEINGRDITLRYTWTTFSDHIPAEAIQQYRADYKKILDLVEFTLSITRSGAETGNNPAGPVAASPPVSPSSSSSTINWEAVWLVFALGVVFTALFKWFNSMGAPIRYNAGSGEPVRGWVIVLALTLGASIALEIIYMVRVNYFDASRYAEFGVKGGRKLQYLLLTELGVYTWTIGGCLATLYWLLSRRDIFPRMFTGLVVSIIGGELLLLVLYYAIPFGNSVELQTTMAAEVTRSMVYGAIWITYVQRSERVKNTFVVPFGKQKDGYM
ncbi:MAG TPA: DUF2569 domain-containing protein, partial [Chitinophagaceae bacterium]